MLISKANFWSVIFQLWMRYIKPLELNPERILQWMMSTGEMILHGTVIVMMLFVLMLSDYVALHAMQGACTL